MNSETMNIDLSVIVPVYNEEEILWQMTNQLAVHLDKIVGIGRWHYILVDNGSFDSTPQIIERIVQHWPDSIQIRLSEPNIGKAQAAGLGQAQGEWAYVIQADLWDHVFLQWAWLNRIRYDLILGSKCADNSLNQRTRYRKILTWGLNTILKFLLDFVGTDTHGDKLLHLPSMRPVLKECIMSRGQYDTEFVLRAMRRGLSLAEFPIPIVEKRPPRNWMIKKIAQNLWDIFWLWKTLKNVPSTHSLQYHRWGRKNTKNVNVREP